MDASKIQPHSSYKIKFSKQLLNADLGQIAKPSVVLTTSSNTNVKHALAPARSSELLNPLLKKQGIVPNTYRAGTPTINLQLNKIIKYELPNVSTRYINS